MFQARVPVMQKMDGERTERSLQQGKFPIQQRCAVPNGCREKI